MGFAEVCKCVSQANVFWIDSLPTHAGSPVSGRGENKRCNYKGVTGLPFTVALL